MMRLNLFFENTDLAAVLVVSLCVTCCGFMFTPVPLCARGGLHSLIGTLPDLFIVFSQNMGIDLLQPEIGTDRLK